MKISFVFRVKTFKQMFSLWVSGFIFQFVSFGDFYFLEVFIISVL